MKFLRATAFLENPYFPGEDLVKQIERAGRTCYKSEGNISEDSTGKFIRAIIKSGHESVLEHGSISARFLVDRGVSHEIVRHRLASFSQESTRYCNYANDKFGNELTFIVPCFWETDDPRYEVWVNACQFAEYAYMELIKRGAKAEEARAVLPNSIKTELVMTTNPREWRHFFKLRCAPAAHPQIRQVTLILLEEMFEKIPFLFDDIYEEYFGKQDDLNEEKGFSF